MTRPQSSTTQCFRIITKPVSTSTSTRLPWMPLVKANGIAARREVVRHRQGRGDVWRQQVRAVIGEVGDLPQGHAGRAVRVRHRVVADVEGAGLRLQDRGGDLQDTTLQLAARLEGRLAADTGAPAGPGRPAGGRGFGVAGQNPDVIAVDAEAFGDDLADDRLAALALLGDADRATHLAGGRQLEDASVLRRDVRAPDPVERRRRVGDLHVGGDADAAVDTPFRVTRPAPHAGPDSPSGRGASPGRWRGRASRTGTRSGWCAGTCRRSRSCAAGSRTDRGRAGRPRGPRGVPSPRRRSDGRPPGTGSSALCSGHHRQVGAVIGQPVRRADQAHDLIALHRARAR